MFDLSIEKRLTVIWLLIENVRNRIIIKYQEKWLRHPNDIYIYGCLLHTSKKEIGNKHGEIIEMPNNEI